MAQAGEQKKQQGYTEPDRAVRCIKCSIGKDAFGARVGAVIVRRDVICQIELGRSIKVAEIGRCSKRDDELWPNGSKKPDCRTLYNFVMMPDGQDLGLEKRKVLHCISQACSDLFTLKELKQGHIDRIVPKNVGRAISGLIDEAVAGLAPGYNPNLFTEQEETEPPSQSRPIPRDYTEAETVEDLPF